jgi:hypothetical protein
MLSRVTSRSDGISRSAKRLRVFVIVLMASMTGITLLAWAKPVGLHLELRTHSNAVDPRIAGTIATALIDLALFELTRMLGLVAAEQFFSIKVIQHFRGFAFWLLILAVIGLLAPLVQLRGDGGIAIHFITINLSQLVIFGVTLLLFLLARLLERAGEIEQENQEIV